jgi:hypothetical protein
LKELLYILAAPMTSIVGLAAFTAWWSAAIFVSGIAGFAYLAIRSHDKHYRPSAYDDKISAERMERAREWLYKD